MTAMEELFTHIQNRLSGIGQAPGYTAQHFANEMFDLLFTDEKKHYLNKERKQLEQNAQKQLKQT